PPGRSNAGRISIYPGVMGAAPLAEQLREIDGPLADMRLGEALAVVADSDGDGVNDIAAHAQRDSSEFHHGGRSYLITRGLDEVEEAIDLFTPLEIPRQVAAGRFGEGVAFVGDLDRDGHSEYVVTASHVTASAGRSGGAWLFSGDAGRAGDPGIPLTDFPNHTGYDLLWGASAAGDFNGDGLPDFALLLRDDERPTDSQLAQNPWREVVEGACGPRGYNTGGVYVFLGQPDGQFPTRPSLAFWGADAGSSPESLVGPLDFNGDGYSDLLLGSFRSDPGGRNNAGKSLIIEGRSRLGSGDEIDVICTPYAAYEGPTNGMELGRSVTPLGDINGDGCDDYAVGSRLEDRPSLNDEGGVRIIYGFGGPGCLSQPHAHRLASGERNSQAGWSLAVGDGDGDGRPELAIGAWQSRNENVPVGRVWVIPGDALSALTPRPVSDAETATPTLLSAWGESWTIQGKQRDENFSYRLAFAGGLLAVSAPQAALADQARVGTVSLYRITSSGISSHPAALVFGESERPHGRLGFSLAGRESAIHSQLLIGAPWGSGTGLDNGSVYQLIFAAE
ncbi:MAG: FG-GAP and VCBS repeat-containing protein, partial [Myxococcota bacterium]|nr:FG-GAP and VCBS repeat-containing protein [Myxococcota bacterium]